jgi:hypothetical protein
MVEFALVLIFFLVPLLYALTETLAFISSREKVMRAANQIAQVASTAPSNADIQNNIGVNIQVGLNQLNQGHGFSYSITFCRGNGAVAQFPPAVPGGAPGGFIQYNGTTGVASPGGGTTKVGLCGYGSTAVPAPAPPAAPCLAAGAAGSTQYVVVRARCSYVPLLGVIPWFSSLPLFAAGIPVNASAIAPMAHSPLNWW